MHKMFEETLTGEPADGAGSLTERTGASIRMLGREHVADPSTRLSEE